MALKFKFHSSTNVLPSAFDTFPGASTIFSNTVKLINAELRLDINKPWINLQNENCTMMPPWYTFLGY